MDQRSFTHHPPQRSGPPKHGPTPAHPQKRNYKLLIDPVLVSGASKLYRFEGVVEGDPTYPTVVLRDPRKQKIWIRPETMDISVPRFKIDSDYVGSPPPLEVTIFNINDNIDRQFLHNEIVNKHQCGPIEELEIFTHELSRKHLGVARLVFEEPESARMCVKKLNNATLMGKILQVFLDPFGKECKKRVAETGAMLEEEAKKEEEAKEAKKRPPPPAKPPPPPPPPEEETQSQPSNRERDRRTSEKTEPERNRFEESRIPPSGTSFPPPSSSSNVTVPTSFYPEQPRQPQYSYPPQQNFQSYEHYHHYQGYPYQGYRGVYPQGVVPGPQWGGPGGPPNIPPPHQPWHQPHQPPHMLNPPPNDHHASNSLHSWDSNRYHSQEHHRSAQNGGNFQKGPSETVAKTKLDERIEKLERPVNSKSKVESEEEEDKSTLDLDTRIAMLLQNKDSAMAASFLALGLGSDEDEDKKDGIVKDEKKLKDKQSTASSSGSSLSDSESCSSSSGGSESDVGEGSKESSGGEGKSDWSLLETILEPISTPPSPFLSQKTYLYWHEKSIEFKKEAQKREREENRERLKKLKKKKPKKRTNVTREKDKKIEVKDEPINDESQVNGIDDDRMSLSSLSSTEDPILHQDVPIPPAGAPVSGPGAPYTAPPPGYNQYAPPPGYPPSYMPSGYPPHTMAPEASYPWQPPGYAPNFVSSYPGYNPGYMALPPGYTNMAHPPPGGTVPGQSYPPYFGPGYPPPQESGDTTHKSGEYHDPTINAVLDTVIEELKNILKKDFYKRMIETTAFKTFDSWWDEQERKFKAEKESVKNESHPVSGPQARIDKINSLSSLLENQEGFGLDSLGSMASFGLGFRAAMPKMPSFRKIRKIKPPSPPCMDEDSQGVRSEDEESKQSQPKMPDSSDSDSRPDDLVPASKVKPPSTVTRKPKWSSDESEADSNQSSDDEDNKVESSSSSSSSEESDSSSSSSDSGEEEEEELKELTELRLMEEEFNAQVKSTVESVMRTPEHVRSCTPIPEIPEEVEDAWLDGLPEPAAKMQSKVGLF
ncbi:hypothetical protein SK128_010805 [Halocaridina rubra]|uniref:RRM domain-containing protein n=1 Tax=Halocaridina rubra TaxID=373956 RepID=A0AAN8XK37_HALRR